MKTEKPVLMGLAAEYTPQRSIVTAVNSTIIKQISILIPNIEASIRFDEIIKPIFNKIKNNSEQIETLKDTRDTLLPKLMSGEIRVEGFGG